MIQNIIPKTSLKFLLPIALLVLVFPRAGLAQGTIAEKEQFTKYIQASSEVGYITFFGGLGNMPALWYEGKLVPNYIVRVHSDAKWALVLTPKIILRMFQGESNPVRRPSYMPQATLHYQLNKPSDRYSNVFHMFARVVHHSNGQQGPFYLANGELNLEDGDFSTNYLEAGLFLSQRLAANSTSTQFFRSSIEYHSPVMQYEPLNATYGSLRWHNDIQIFEFSTKAIKEIFSRTAPSDYSDAERHRPDFRAWINTTVIFGEMAGVDKWDVSKRFNLSVKLSYHPFFLGDVRLFAEYYYGQDYYNMSYETTLNILRAGLMVDTLSI